MFLKYRNTLRTHTLKVFKKIRWFLGREGSSLLLPLFLVTFHMFGTCASKKTELCKPAMKFRMLISLVVHSYGKPPETEKALHYRWLPSTRGQYRRGRACPYFLTSSCQFPECSKTTCYLLAILLLTKYSQSGIASIATTISCQHLSALAYLLHMLYSFYLLLFKFLLYLNASCSVELSTSPFSPHNHSTE